MQSGLVRGALLSDFGVGMGAALGGRPRRGYLSFPALMARAFGPGSDGVVDNFSDLLSIYQESLGVTPGAIGSAMGLAVDARTALGPELLSNWNFGTGDTTGWTLAGGTASVVAGVVTLTNVGTRASLSQAIATVVGQQYRVSFGSISNGASSTATVRVTSTNSFSGTLIASATATSANGFLFFIATTTTTFFWLSNGAVGATLTVSYGGVSLKSDSGNHVRQSVSASRPVETAYGPYIGALFDGGDDSLASPIGGGGTDGFFWCGAIKVVGNDGAARTIFSDVGTNAGYRVRIASTNQLALGAGDGSAFTSVAAALGVLAGNFYVLTAWDDGVSLNAQVNRGEIAQAARPVVSAGGAGFSIAKDNNAASGFANIALFAQVYRKNGGVSARDRLAAQFWCASKIGLAI